MSPDALTVMAYVDGELSAAERTAFEAALVGDPVLREAVAREQALRAALGDAFAPVLAEPVPARLRAALGTSVAAPVPAAPVIDLQSVRAQRARRRWQWPEWGAMAACLAIGVALGLGPNLRRGDAWLARAADGGLIAQGPFARALTRDLASVPNAGPVAVGLSFVARDQRYCRSFTLSGAQPSAGLACRAGDGWAVVALVPASPPRPGGGFRTAASALPPALLAQIDAMSAAPPLDAAAERAARDRGWRPPD